MIEEKKSPLEGWVVVAVDGMRLVGSMAKDGDTFGLSPAYELRCDVVAMPVQTPKGHVFVPQMIRQLTPLHCCAGITAYPLPNDARCIALHTLPDEDQREFLALVETVQDGIRAVRAHQKSGLVVPQ